MKTVKICTPRVALADEDGGAACNTNGCASIDCSLPDWMDDHDQI
jgi:hypothetical protein